MTDPETFDTDVLVVGSGFGGSVAALRFAEAGYRVNVLERGDRVSRESFQADADMFWNPKRHLFGMNELKPRGKTVIPWLGSAVGGGSHVYAATLKRRAHFDDFPPEIAEEGLDRWYDLAERMLDGVHYPDYPPYSTIRSLRILYEAESIVAREHPDLVEEMGPILLGVSFAPPDQDPGAEFVNRHGAAQRYSDPDEQKILGGDIGAKNTLDLNYLHLAEELGVEVHALCEADRIDPLAGGGYSVSFIRYRREGSALKRLIRFWIPAREAVHGKPETVRTRRLVLAAGSIGTTELLLRNRDVHKTLPDLSTALGSRYSSNGDFVNAIIPFRGLFVTWGGFGAAVAGLLGGWWWLVGVGAILYFLGLLVSKPPADPDLGTTNSDYIRFRHRDGSTQGSYIEGGRYPTPDRFAIASLMSALGVWNPARYRAG